MTFATAADAIAAATDAATDSGGATTPERLSRMLRPIRTVGSDVRVLEGLAELVMRGGMAVGDRFPAERDLAVRLGVGRSTVREALKRWEALGIVERRKGRGTYLLCQIVPGALHVPLTLHLEGDALLRTLEVRRALELEVVPLACRRGTDAQLEAVRAAYDLLHAAHARKGASPREDRAFHRAIYDAANNPIFGQIIEQTHDAFDAIYVRPFGDVGFADESFPLHQAIAKAVVARDESGAKAATEAMLAIVSDAARRNLRP